ncbi:MAG: hypothetical protein HY690_16640 [Chloroflexi bacterium]|nr:hypothetical protein [Chloroflexota bacterium]
MRFLFGHLACCTALLLSLAATVAPSASASAAPAGAQLWLQVDDGAQQGAWGAGEPQTGAPAATAPVGALDCGTDLDCFAEAAGQCVDAQVSWATTLNVFGVLSTLNMLLSTQGMDSDLCVLYALIERVDVRFSDELVQQSVASGATEEQLEQAEQAARQQARTYEGLDGTCKLPPEDLAAGLSKLNADGFSTQDLNVGACDGPLFLQQLGW